MGSTSPSSGTSASSSALPKRALVVGGGYIGLELGTVYRKLGADVTVVEMMDRVVPVEDADVAGILDLARFASSGGNGQGWRVVAIRSAEAARALIGELGALIASRPLAVWVERFAGADCCVTPVLDAHEALFGRAPVTLGEGMQRLTAPALTLR